VGQYETRRQQQVARMLDLLPTLLARLTWPVERLRAERESALRALVSHAQARSPWHRRRLATVQSETLRESDLGALPTMTKDDLMDHFDEIVTDSRLTRDVVERHLAALRTDAYLLDTYHACASGGSSGRRGAFVYDFDGWALDFASYLRFTIRLTEQVLGAGVVPTVLAMVGANKATHMTAAMSETFALPGAVSHRLPATWPLDRIVTGLNELQPDYLVAYASLLHQLTREAAAGRLRIAPRIVNATSEPLLPEIRAAVAATWPVPLSNTFGTTEGLMGGSCSAQRGIHLSDDLCIIEPVDADGNPVPPGTRAAKVFLTNLYNRTQPLIRYELTDEITVLDGPCSCGTTLLRIDDIQGRLDDCFTYPDGPTIHPFTFRSVLGRERRIIEYQVRQTPRGADVQVRCEGGIDTARIGTTIREALVELGLNEAEISVVPVETLTRQATGKLRRFVPLASACAR
jgi:phenylacetate-coenzyme A ligase PaaK-like adenylate-forming protein